MSALAFLLFASLDAQHRRAALAELNRSPEGYQCKTNPRRMYLSCADRDAFDLGFSEYPNEPPEFASGIRTPRVDGYNHAFLEDECRQMEREEARQERVADERAKEDR